MVEFAMTIYDLPATLPNQQPPHRFMVDTSRLARTDSHIPISITVAVGTTIADRPPHRSVRARLRIRLLPRMNGVEALVGIRMQNTWVRNPPVEQWVETVPSHLRALTATD